MHQMLVSKAHGNGLLDLRELFHFGKVMDQVDQLMESMLIGMIQMNPIIQIMKIMDT